MILELYDRVKKMKRSENMARANQTPQNDVTGIHNLVEVRQMSIMGCNSVERGVDTTAKNSIDATVAFKIYAEKC